MNTKYKQCPMENMYLSLHKYANITDIECPWKLSYLLNPVSEYQVWLLWQHDFHFKHLCSIEMPGATRPKTKCHLNPLSVLIVRNGFCVVPICYVYVDIGCC